MTRKLEAHAPHGRGERQKMSGLLKGCGGLMPAVICFFPQLAVNCQFLNSAM